MMSSTPAAVAMTAMSVPIPEKLRWRRYARPVKMSQIPSNNDPKLLFIMRLQIKNILILDYCIPPERYS
jgi:hypothetical protein